MIARIVAAFDRPNQTTVLVYDNGLAVVCTIPAEPGVYQTPTTDPAPNPLMEQLVRAGRARRKQDAPKTPCPDCTMYGPCARCSEAPF